MEIGNFIIKYKDTVKNNILNIVITIIALNIAANVFKSQNKTVNALKSQIGNEKRKNELLVDLGKTGEKLGLYKISFKKRDFSAVVKRVNFICGELELEILALKPRQEEDGAEYNKYPFILSIQAGDYHQIGKFVNKIESSLAVYFIESLTIEKVTLSPEQQEAEGKTHKLKSDMNLCLYALKE